MGGLGVEFPEKNCCTSERRRVGKVKAGIPETVCCTYETWGAGGECPETVLHHKDERGREETTYR